LEPAEVALFRITKQFSFSASHVLDHLPAGHPCARLHGHNYRVEVVVESPCLDDRGFCQLDYRELDGFEAYLDEALDHRHLNDVLPCRTTAENLARFLHAEARKASPFVVAVRVSETEKTWAEYRGPA
jgi:6-pyruvoyltetrahydropterin/6-carboxytetrahydropterin synthase